MNATEHLTRNQIAAFSDGSLAAAESHSVGRHLLRCLDCRSLLPLPDTKLFWAAVTTERDAGNDEVASNDNLSRLQSLLKGLVDLLTNPRSLAWGMGLMVVAFGLTAFGLFLASNEQPLETEVARSFQTEEPESSPSNNGFEYPNIHNPVSVAESKNPLDDATRDRVPASKGSLDARRKLTSQFEDRGNTWTGRSNRNISSTRGARQPCSSGRQVEVELGFRESDIVLRWNPIPKAAKYHLYISDNNEILVDEFETERETSYILKKQLDPTKAYKWKIVITLESGQNLYIDAQKFSSKDYQSYNKGFRGKAKSNSRCLAN